MKKNFAPSKILKKLRLRRKTLLGGLLVLVVVLLAAAVWRGFLPAPAVLLPWRATEASREAETDKEPVETPAQGGEYENESAAGAGAEEETTPVLTLPSEPMSWPVEGELLAGHHDVYRIDNTLRIHVGVDLKADPGTAVKAAWPGVVDRIAKDPRLGWLLEIRHAEGYLTQYANLEEETVLEVGTEVEKGKVIGKVGESAKLDASTGAFLHFAVYRDGTALNPLEVIP